MFILSHLKKQNCQLTDWPQEVSGISPDPNLAEKLDKLKHLAETQQKQKATRNEKRVTSLQKKKATLESKPPTTTTTGELNQVKKELEKLAEEAERMDADGFAFSKFMPLTRMMTEDESTRKSARAKALANAVSVAEGGSEGVSQQDVSRVVGLQAAKVRAAEQVGITLTSSKQKQKTDKNLKDIFKMASHVLK